MLGPSDRFSRGWLFFFAAVARIAHRYHSFLIMFAKKTGRATQQDAVQYDEASWCYRIYKVFKALCNIFGLLVFFFALLGVAYILTDNLVMVLHGKMTTLEAWIIVFMFIFYVFVFIIFVVLFQACMKIACDDLAECTGRRI